ncbi:hypothetical protein OIU76_013323 [Salix suchowensis]|uniref:Uncharacterized protein n=1 Tax=Salix suchowensis TaxID=1278906 RepID=A0ABQ9A430_9ROSI|nr:hypothetical protein OIU76_013323 [Salix suchowensis]KAJ6322667.1 hypothetical protein OIU77_012498 [Salix suchowensis]
MSLASSTRRYRNRLRVFCFLVFFVEHLNLNHQGSSPAPVRDRRVKEDETTGKFGEIMVESFQKILLSRSPPRLRTLLSVVKGYGWMISGSGVQERYICSTDRIRSEKVDLRRREIVVDTEDEVIKDAVFEQGVRPHYTEED